MQNEEFKALKDKATKLYASQKPTDKHRVSLDAIFSTLAITQSKKVHKVTEEDAPEWFEKTLAKLKGSKEKLTVSRFLMLAGKFPATRSESISVGRWLREAGIIPRKTGGQMLFEIK